jgi:transcriptional regulator with XRE-family HTH domain
MLADTVRDKWNPLLLKRLRGKRTQEEFARLIGAPKNTVWRWEARYAKPSAAYAKRLSRLAEREQFLADWEPVGSITWVGDLEAGAREIALEFSRSLTRSGRRPASNTKAAR